MAFTFTMDEQKMNRKLAKLPAVQAELKLHANGVKSVAEGIFAPHRKTGRHHFVVGRVKVKYGRIDWFCSFVGPAAAAVENGHFHNRTGRWIPGVHALGAAHDIYGAVH